MSKHRPPVHPRRPGPHPPPARHLTALVRGIVLAALGWCVLAHGPLEPDAHGAGPLPVAAAPAPASSEHHQPGDHHGGEECATDQAQRLPVAAPDFPPAPGTPALIAVAVVAVPRACRRSPLRRHIDGRTGRATLVHTSRWRI
ncbi:hypothetical protein [Streptomyces sp. NPDC005955]|uniref:hypothetical protein n=1 Tax=Streptomyces sp. NPDC005955 TaxID=3364738 RepID=UPI003691EE4E